MKKGLWFLAAMLLSLNLLFACSKTEQPATEPESREQQETENKEEEISAKTAADIENGTYTLEVESSSSMFRVVKAELTVTDTDMSAVLTLSGTGYLKLYMGTGEDALNADESEFIPFVEDAEGAYTYTVPVAALDAPIDCAAFSKKKQQWYDRELVFLSETMQPAGASGTDAGAQGETESVTGENAVVSIDDITDGTYTVEVTLEGGSGKSTVLSPAVITVTDSQMVATIEWSSPNYDYMLVDGEKYLPTNTEGNSTFEIPVAAFDEAIPVVGDTVAMSTPHEVEYTLTFHSETIGAAE